MRTRALFGLLACMVAIECAAQVRVYSPRAEAVSVTIYRDGLALITETRQVELPAEAVTLVLEGVVDTLLPRSAVILGAERAPEEVNFDFETLNPHSLLRRSVGREVVLVRTHPRTGRVTRRAMTILSVNEGVVLAAPDGSEALRCSGLPERLEFSDVPQELGGKPTLSARFAAGAPGSRTITLSYLAHGFSWSSDYLARLDARGARMHLTGWVTLRNDTHTSFADAQVQVVAGNLNLVDAGEGGSADEELSEIDEDETDETTGLLIGRADLLREEEESEIEWQMAALGRCFAIDSRQTSAPPTFYRPAPLPELARDSSDEMLESVVLATTVDREELGDYQLYRLPWRTDLNARQTKQAVFLSKPRVKVERIYGVRLDDLYETTTDPEGAPNVLLRWKNERSAGLGEPLPAGKVRVFERNEAGDIFAGEDRMTDKPVGLPVELVIARALDLGVAYTSEEETQDLDDGDERVTVKAVHEITNNKPVPVTVEVRHSAGHGVPTPRVVRSSVRTRRKDGDLMWRVRVPAHGTGTLRYSLQVTE